MVEDYNSKDRLLMRVEKILAKESISLDELKNELLIECKRQLLRFDKIVKQSDAQQRDLIKLNEELDDYKHNLEKKVEEEIKKREKNEKLLLQQSKLASMGEMMDAMGHQLKQPLNVIAVSVSQLEIMGILGEEIREEDIENIIVTVKKQVEHLSTTIDEFRNFLRPNKNREDVFIADLIESVKSLLKDRLKINSIKIEIEFDENLSINIVKNEFIHIFLNIFNNSIDAFIEKNIQNRVIKIKANENENNLSIYILDNAGGVPDEVLPNIFKANVTTKEEGKGTGMGLYMSKLIIEKIGGSINVKNSDNGVEFEIVVPKHL